MLAPDPWSKTTDKKEHFNELTRTGAAMASNYQRYFKLLAHISKKIHANNDIRDILTCIVENIAHTLSAKGCIYWILNPEKQRIENKIFHGFDYRSLLRVDYPSLMAIFKNRASDQIELLNARENPDIPDLERLGKRKINSITGIFFDITQPYVGLLAVYFMGNKTISKEKMELITALGEQGALALEKAIGYDEKMLTMYREIVEGFALALEARDPHTHGHSRRVAVLSQLTARQLKLSEKQIQDIYHAGLLHDIGKIGTGDHILSRLGKLSKKEMAQIRQHPDIGGDILSPLSFFSEIETLVRHHHERMDGNGYPRGKKAKDIPMGAKIIGACDAFETMISGRSHIPAMPMNDAIEALEKGVDAQFDPHVIQALFSVIRCHPDVLEIKESIEYSLDTLRQNMVDLAKKRRLENKLSSPFPPGF